MKKRWISVFVAIALVLTMVTPFTAEAVESGAEYMTASEDLVRLLKSVEGFVAKPYWDYSQWTVGYGTACPADKLEEYQKNGIPEPEAQKLLIDALEWFEYSVNNFANKYDLHLEQHQFDALVSFSYNCGTAWMSKTETYFNTAIREQGTVNELVYGFCLHSTAGGEYILINRRLSEANMYLNGEYKVYYAPGGVPSYMRFVYLDGNGGEVRYAICGYDARENGSINVSFNSVPTGIDENGEPFVCTLEGWYTSSGKKVEKLDGSLDKGQVLTARWVDPDGNIVDAPRGTLVNMDVSITGDYVNVRSGPGTQYNRVGGYELGNEITLKEVYQVDDYTWGRTNMGWIRLDYTNYEEVKASFDTFPKSGAVTADTVNLRSGPGTGYNTVGTLQRGDRVTVTEEASGSGLRWGKLSDGNWVCLDYVRYDSEGKTVVSVTLVSRPNRTEYVQKIESLHLEGCVVQITYSDGSSTALTPTQSMIYSYDNATLGETTASIICEGTVLSFKITIIKATVTFLNYDGTVLSSEQYAYGETVVPPQDPVRESDGNYYYMFNGWDREVTACAGNAVYTATFMESEAEDVVIVPQSITSDVYTVEDGVIRKIALGTTVETLIEGINESGYIVVYSGNTAVSGTATVTTGMTVSLEYEGEKIQTLTVAVTGDVNGDGMVSITDALMIKAHVLGKQTLSEVSQIAADTSGDGNISLTDFLQVKAKVLGSGEITAN